MKKKALVFGASGNMGSYMAEFLVEKGYEVYGTYSGLFRDGSQRPAGVEMRMVLLLSPRQIKWAMEQIQPDEVYNFAAKMFAPASWESPTDYMAINAQAVAQMLETLWQVSPQAKFFQAGSAEVFGKHYYGRINERCVLVPDSPYGVSKAAAQELVRTYREKKNRFACTGIFFNAESPRRDKFFFASKVAKEVARIKRGDSTQLKLGCLHAQRDWGLAAEYVEAAWLMLQSRSGPCDYVIATGNTASCLEFAKRALRVAELPEEMLSYQKSEKFDYDAVYANPHKIFEDLGWTARTRFPDVVDVLVREELEEKIAVHSGAVR